MWNNIHKNNYFRKKYSAALMKKKKSILSRIVRSILIIAAIPIVILWIAIIALYLPPVQRYAADVLCRKISESSGYDISIGSLHLAFPLKLNIGDFSMSRNGTPYINGEKANLNVSLLPLLTGEVELNYIYLENIGLDTKEMIPDVAINGNIGYFRTVARNVDFEKEIADIRQVHLHSTHLDITLTDTVPSNDEEEESTFKWAFRLHKGNIEDCSVNIALPAQGITATASIGNLELDGGTADIGTQTYTLERLGLDNCGAEYDRRGGNAPLDHINVNKISLDFRDLAYTPEYAKAEINDFTLTQPGGIKITRTSASLFADNNSLEVRRLIMDSSNGSYVIAKGSMPWEALRKGAASKLIADLDVRLNKRDLAELITEEQYKALSIFQDDMFSSNIKVCGNMSRMEIDTLNIIAPAIATVGAKGYATDLSDAKRMAATLQIQGSADDIRRFIDNKADTIANADGKADISGTIGYSNGTADADIDIAAAGGTAIAKATYDVNASRYDADIAVSEVEINRIMPGLPLKKLTMNMTAKGEGTDLFSRLTTYNAHITLDTLLYGETALGNIILDASQANSLSRIDISGDDSNLKFSINAETLLDSAMIKNSTHLDIAKADFGKLNIVQGLSTQMQLALELSTDMGEVHAIRLKGENIGITTPQKRFTPKNIYINAATTPDSTFIYAQNGDLNINGEMSSGYNGLFSSLDKVARLFMDALQNEDMVHYLQDYEKELPTITLGVQCGRDNMLANLLAMNGVTANSMNIDLKMDSIDGLNMRGGVYGLKSGELNLDTVRVLTRQEGNRIRYFAGVRSTALNPDNVKESYNAALFGNLADDTLSTNFVFRDQNEKIGVRIGATTKLRPRSIDITFKPQAMLLGKKFSFNPDNYINIGEGFKTDADVMLSSNEGTGMHLRTLPGGEQEQSANLELWGLDLKSLTSIIPYSPDIAGTLDLDLHFRQDSEGILLSSDINAGGLSYEGVYVGNERIEAVYLPKEDNTHYLDLLLMHEEEEVAHISGNYMESGNGQGLDGDISLTRFPLEISKAFMQDAGVSLSGYLNGEMSAKGEFSRLNTNGRIQFESVDIDAYGFGTSLHMADETVRIIDNKLQFNDFSIYAKGDNPFKINGNVDFTHLSNPAFDLRMNANDYEFINSGRKKGSMFYGRLFVDTKAMIGGTLNNMRFYGDVTMLGKSNITYVMLDAPIESDKELDGLVEFVNFNDTTTFVTQDDEIDLGNINLNLSLRIDDGARINADLDEGRNNYVTTQGNGNLHITYTSEAGLNVTGRYNMNGGDFKLSLPVIPLKTLQISDGSNVSWTGPILEPELNITAMERVTSSVTFDDNNMVPVPFDVGVKVSNTLSNMGLSFVMSSPENATVQEQLNALDTETMNRYAVTMLITGAYAGSSKSMTVANALNSFIDAKINDIAGTAMKSVSVNVGINDATNVETGNTYKNYSFSFSKRFWNDRITFVIGGEVNSGEHRTSNNSFINNASLEWKISENSNRFLKLFYDKNYESILEGEITEMGIGYVYKRKLNRLKELFIFNSNRRKKADVKQATSQPPANSGNNQKKETKESK